MSFYSPPTENLPIFNSVVFKNTPATTNVESSTPSGTIITFAGSPIPDNYLICDGSNYLINDYPILATLLGTLYGTPSTGFFTVPNLVDKFIKGAASSAGVSGGSRYDIIPSERVGVHRGNFWSGLAGFPWLQKLRSTVCWGQSYSAQLDR